MRISFKAILGHLNVMVTTERLRSLAPTSSTLVFFLPFGPNVFGVFEKMSLKCDIMGISAFKMS